MKYPHLNVMDQLKTVKVTHDFIGENEDEISLKKGEHVIVIEKDDEFQDGWWRGRNAHGEIGLFPMNYVLETPGKQQVSPPPVSSLEQKIDTLEDTLSAMQLTNTNTTTTRTNSSNVLTTTTSSPLLSSIKSRRSSTYSSRSNTSAQTYNSNNNNNTTSRMGPVTKPNIQQVIVNSMSSPILSDTPPEEWTIGQVASWLDIIGFKDIIDSFKDQEITGDVLLELTQQSLKELGIGTFGKRYKLHSAIQSLKEEASRRDQIINENPDILPQHQIESEKPYQHHRRNGSFDDDSSLYNGGRSTTTNSVLYSDNRLSDLERRVMNSISNTSGYNTHRGNDINRVPSISAPLNNRQRTSNVPRSSSEYTFRQPSTTPSSHDNYASYPSSPPSSIIKQGPSIDQIKSIRSSQSPQQSNNRPSFFRGSFLGGGGGTSPLIGGNSYGTGLFSSLGRSSVDMPTKRDTMNGKDGKAEMEGWLHKQGDRYKTWNKRWFVLRGANLFYFKSPKDPRVKGIINLVGYNVIADETIQSGKYCFKMQHDTERTFYFYTNSEKALKSWMRALMKVNISRNYADPVLSSSSIATVSLETARRMRPRPPSIIMGSNNDENSSHTTHEDHHPMRNISESQAFARLTGSPQHQTTSLPPPPIMRQSRSENLTSSTPSIFRQPSQQQHYHPSSASSLSRQNYPLSQQIFEPTFLSSTNGRGSIDHQSVDTAFEHSLDDRDPTISSPNESSIHGGQAHLSTVYDVPDENDEDLIDPQQKHITKLESTDNIHDLEWKSSDYVVWVNDHIMNEPIQRLEQMRTGEPLIGLLEGLTGKTVRRQNNDKSKTPSMKALDTIVAAFRFMGREGITVDGSFTIKDIFGGDEGKIKVMLDTIKDWYDVKSKKDQTS